MCHLRPNSEGRCSIAMGVRSLGVIVAKTLDCLLAWSRMDFWLNC